MGVFVSRARFVPAVVAVAVLLAACNLGSPPVMYPAAVADSVFKASASADLNGDGVFDVVVADDGSYTVLLSNGSGGFTVTAAPSPHQMSLLTLADYTADGEIDLAYFVDDGTSTAYVRAGDGTGGFGSPVSFGFRAIKASGDLNGDGHLDIIERAGAGIGVRLGDGAGGYGSSIDYPISPSSAVLGVTSVEMADFTHDGQLDVVVGGQEITCPTPSTCSFPSAVALLTGDGAGGLQVGARRSALDSDLALADIDEDGNLDVIGSGFLANVSLLRGTGTADLAPPTTLPLDKKTCGVEAADIDNDGHVDLVLAGENHAGTVLWGDGDGNFPTSQAIETAGSSFADDCNDVLSRNFDGDAKPDVAFLGDETNQVAVLHNGLTQRPT